MKITKSRLLKLIKESTAALVEDKLSPAQSDKMDSDKDGDIDGKDLKTLRKDEAIFKIVKEEYARIKGTLYEETKPHEDDRHPPDTPTDRIRLEEGNEASKLIDALGKVGEGIEGVLGNMSDDPKDAPQIVQNMPEIMKTLQAANEQIQQIWEAMHDMLGVNEGTKQKVFTPSARLGVNEETKPDEVDRKPTDTPADRLRK